MDRTDFGLLVSIYGIFQLIWQLNEAKIAYLSLQVYNVLVVFLLDNN